MTLVRIIHGICALAGRMRLLGIAAVSLWPTEPQIPFCVFTARSSLSSPSFAFDYRYIHGGEKAFSAIPAKLTPKTLKAWRRHWTAVEDTSGRLFPVTSPCCSSASRTTMTPVPLSQSHRTSPGELICLIGSLVPPLSATSLAFE